METPNARVMKEGHYRIGVNQIDPYRYYYGVVSIFNSLEIDGRITETIDVPALSQNYGNYKDKAIDFKYRFMSEGKYRPAIAIGVMDPHGTRVYPSQYIVASKQIYPFDLSLGLGNGRFGRRSLPSSGDEIKIEILRNPKEWYSDAQFFGGIQFTLSRHFTLMAEYSPIRYNEQTQDPAQPKHFQNPVSSKINFGLRWKPYDWTELDLTYQRGNQIGANLSFSFDLGKPLIPIYDHPYKEQERYRSDPVVSRIVRALYESGFGSIGVLINGDVLLIEAQNDKYYYSMKAIGVALKAIAPIIPDRIDVVRFTLQQDGIPLVQYSTTREDLRGYVSGKFTAGEFFTISEIDTGTTKNLDTRIEHRDWYDIGIKPSLQTFLNDPSGFFKYRLGAEAWIGLHAWPGSSFVFGVEAYPLNNISSVNTPSQTPVRTDDVLYLEKKLALGRLLYDQVEKFPHEVYGRITGGILEYEYTGLDAEVARPLFGSRLLIGASGSLVKKRHPENPFAFKANDFKDYYTTAFFNTRLNLPEYETYIELNSGQFLAGDKGTRITIAKNFNGVVLSAWYSFNDTSVFKDSFNQGYHDKGIAISIPMRLFEGTDSRKTYSIGLSPWTRDVAQDISHFNPLFDFIGRTTDVYLKKDLRLLH